MGVRALLSTKDRPGLLWAQGLVHVTLLSIVTHYTHKKLWLGPQVLGGRGSVLSVPGTGDRRLAGKRVL